MIQCRFRPWAYGIEPEDSRRSSKKKDKSSLSGTFISHVTVAPSSNGSLRPTFSGGERGASGENSSYIIPKADANEPFYGIPSEPKGLCKKFNAKLPSCFLQAAEGGKITQIVFCTILQNPPLKLCDSSGCEWSRAAWQIAVKNRFAVKLTNISRTVNTNLLTLTICFWSDGSFEVEAFVCRNEIIYLGVGEYKSCNHDKPTCLLILLTSSRPLSQTLQMAKRRNRCRV